MSKVTMTVGQIIDLGLWDKVVEYKGWDPYILNEGRIRDEDEVEFDTEFKRTDNSVDDLKGKVTDELKEILSLFEEDLSSSGIDFISEYLRNELYYLCGMEEEYYEEGFDELRDRLKKIVE